MGDILAEFGEWAADQPTGGGGCPVMLGAERRQMRDRTYAADGSNRHSRCCRWAAPGLDGMRMQTEQRREMSAPGPADNCDLIGADSPQGGIGNELCNRRPAVVPLGRKAADRTRPIADAGHRIAVAGQPGDRTIAAVDGRPVIARQPDNQRHRPLAAATRQKEIKPLLFRCPGIGDVAMTDRQPAVRLDGDGNRDFAEADLRS